MIIGYTVLVNLEVIGLLNKAKTIFPHSFSHFLVMKEEAIA